MIYDIIKVNTLSLLLAIIILVLVFILMIRLNIMLTRTKSNSIKDMFSNTNSRYNEIVYGMNPTCANSNVKSNTKFCPNEHPNIPCSLVENCNISNKHLTDDMKRDIYMYVYLTGLLESSDIFNAERDDYWYNYKKATNTSSEST